MALSEEISRALAGMSWWQKHGRESLHFFLRALLFCAGFLIFTHSALGWRAFGIAVMSYAFYGIAITGTHESSHGSFFASKRLNRAALFFFSDFWGGQSGEWWYHRHVRVHHVYPNVPSREPQEFYFPWLHKSLYFFAAPLLAPAWVFGYSVWFLWGSWLRLARYVALCLAGWVLLVALLSTQVPLGWAVVCAYLVRSVFAPVFMHLAVFNHLGLETLDEPKPWLLLQTKTTRNLRSHWFLQGIGGNAFLECHIEHHLFPAVSNRMLAHIRPVVMRYLRKEGYEYHEMSYFQCLGHCLRNYETLFPEADVLL